MSSRIRIVGRGWVHLGDFCKWRRGMTAASGRICVSTGNGYASLFGHRGGVVDVDERDFEAETPLLREFPTLAYFEADLSTFFGGIGLVRDHAGLYSWRDGGAAVPKPIAVVRWSTRWQGCEAAFDHAMEKLGVTLEPEAATA